MSNEFYFGVASCFLPALAVALVLALGRAPVRRRVAFAPLVLVLLSGWVHGLLTMGPRGSHLDAWGGTIYLGVTAVPLTIVLLFAIGRLLRPRGDVVAFGAMAALIAGMPLAVLGLSLLGEIAGFWSPFHN